MELQDKTQIGYVVTREGNDQVIPCAIFTNFQEAQDTVDAYNQKFKDEGIEGFEFKLHMTAFFD